MSKTYITITGTHHFYGKDFITPGMHVLLRKEPENPYDREAILVELPGLGGIGHVANSTRTVLGESMSAGRLYDRIGESAVAEVLYVLEQGVIAEVCRESLLGFWQEREDAPEGGQPTLEECVQRAENNQEVVQVTCADDTVYEGRVVGITDLEKKGKAVILDATDDNLAGFHLKQTRRTIAFNEVVSFGYVKGVSHHEALSSPCDEDTFAGFSATIDGLRNMAFEFFVLDLEGYPEQMEFIQTVRQSDSTHYTIELALSAGREKPQIFRLQDASPETCREVFHLVCVEARRPDLAGWKDVTEEIFGGKRAE